MFCILLKYSVVLKIYQLNYGTGIEYRGLGKVVYVPLKSKWSHMVLYMAENKDVLYHTIILQLKESILS